MVFFRDSEHHYWMVRLVNSKVKIEIFQELYSLRNTQMGVYYFYFNKSKNFEQNQFVLNGYFCDFVTKFDSDPIDVQIEFFKKCIELNNWEPTDIIIAVPDYSDHDVIKYDSKANPSISIDNTDKDRFFETNKE